MKTLYIILFLLAAAFTGVQAQTQVGDVINGTNVTQGNRVIQGTKIGVMTTAERDANLSPAAMTAEAKTALRGVAIFNTDTKQQEYWDGTKWVGTGQSWFYMPATVLPTLTTNSNYNATAGEFVYDIYSVYKQQFGMTATATSAASETATIPVYAADKLVYMVTYYDNTVFQNVSVTTDGKLHYKVIAGATPTDATFMNIIFKVK